MSTIRKRNLFASEREKIYEQYIDERRSQADIAREWRVTSQTICKAIKRVRAEKASAK